MTKEDGEDAREKYIRMAESPTRIDNMRSSATAAYVYTTTSWESRRLSSRGSTETSCSFVSCHRHIIIARIFANQDPPTNLIAEGEQVSDGIDLQDRLDNASTRLKIAKNVICEPLYDVHVRICGRHPLLQTRQKVISLPLTGNWPCVRITVHAPPAFHYASRLLRKDTQQHPYSSIRAPLPV